MYIFFGSNHFLSAVLRESLRLTPTAAQRSVTPIGDQIVGDGKYLLSEGTTVVTNEFLQHRDPSVWGEDAEEFKPERMLDSRFEALPVCFCCNCGCSEWLKQYHTPAQCLAALW
jgi:cytochrome P450 / NADPH-cytochrome P450 reductase